MSRGGGGYESFRDTDLKLWDMIDFGHGVCTTLSEFGSRSWGGGQGVKGGGYVST